MRLFLKFWVVKQFLTYLNLLHIWFLQWECFRYCIFFPIHSNYTNHHEPVINIYFLKSLYLLLNSHTYTKGLQLKSHNYYNARDGCQMKPTRTKKPGRNPLTQSTSSHSSIQWPCGLIFYSWFTLLLFYLHCRQNAPAADQDNKWMSICYVLMDESGKW